MSLRPDRRVIAANAAADYEARANQHRPTERELVLREVLRLRAQGLQPRDIAEAFGMNPADVLTMIYGNDEAQL